jgi:hypothetical protein
MVKKQRPMKRNNMVIPGLFLFVTLTCINGLESSSSASSSSSTASSKFASSSSSTTLDEELIQALDDKYVIEGEDPRILRSSFANNMKRSTSQRGSGLSSPRPSRPIPEGLHRPSPTPRPTGTPRPTNPPSVDPNSGEDGEDNHHEVPSGRPTGVPEFNPSWQSPQSRPTQSSQAPGSRPWGSHPHLPTEDAEDTPV